MIIVIFLMLIFGGSHQNGHLAHLNPYGSGPGAPHNVVISNGNVVEWTLAHGD